MNQFDGLLNALNEGMASPDYRDAVVNAEHFLEFLAQHTKQAVEQYLENAERENSQVDVDSSPNSPFIETVVSGFSDVLQKAFDGVSSAVAGGPVGEANQFIDGYDQEGFETTSVETDTNEYTVTIDDKAGTFSIESDGKVIADGEYSGAGPISANVHDAEGLAGALLDVILFTSGPQNRESKQVAEGDELENAYEVVQVTTDNHEYVMETEADQYTVSADGRPIAIQVHKGGSQQTIIEDGDKDAVMSALLDLIQHASQ